MNQSEEIVIRKVIQRLSSDTNASFEIRQMLADRRLRSYLDTWVIGALQCLLPESRNLKLAVGLSD
jgi:hypothetical protein